MTFKEFFNFGSKNENENESRKIREEVKELIGRKARMLTLAALSTLMASAAVKGQSKMENTASVKSGSQTEQFEDSLEQENELQESYTVTIGDYGEKNTPDFIKNILSNVTNEVDDIGIFRAMKLAEEEKTVEVVMKTAKELGLQRGATYKDLKKVLEKNGLTFIEPEAFLQTFLENEIYSSDKKGSSVVAGMQGIKYTTHELDVKNYKEYIPGSKGSGPYHDSEARYRNVKEVNMEETGKANHIFVVYLNEDKIPTLSTVDAPRGLDLINLDQVMAFQKK